MTWVIGSPTQFGYAMGISDIQVLFLGSMWSVLCKGLTILRLAGFWRPKCQDALS